MGYLCLLLNKQHSNLLHTLFNSTTPAAFGMGCVLQLEARTSARRCEINLRVADCAIVTFSRQLFPLKSPRGLQYRIFLFAVEEETFKSTLSTNCATLCNSTATLAIGNEEILRYNPLL